MTISKLLFIRCLSPLHAGTGQGVGAVDLPITREVTTHLPYLPGSSIKGSLRATASAQETQELTKTMFGPDTENASERAGSLVFSDARLVCLPVRSVYGTFAWATSPLLIQRLLRDVKEVQGVTINADLKALNKVSTTTARVSISDPSSLKDDKDMIYLEDLDLRAEKCKDTGNLAKQLGELLFDDETEREMFEKRFIVLHDDVLTFLSKHAVDIRTRTSINPDTKVVKNGQLWTEENLPTESILAALVLEHGHLAHKTDQDVWAGLARLCDSSIQFGGHATTGHGRCEVIIRGGKS